MMFIKKHETGKCLEVLEEPSYAVPLLNPSLVDDTKVLGIPWNTSRDTFSFTIQHLPHDIRPFGHIATSHVAIKGNVSTTL